jgi:hypothetical protein
VEVADAAMQLLQLYVPFLVAPVDEIVDTAIISVSIAYIAD